MGVLRFLLALSVILAHTAPLFGFNLVGGSLAVESFYIISGFYIALILNEKYIKQNNSYWLFISNRFLRLFPFYWVILLLTLICAVSIPHFNDNVFVGGLNMYYEYGSQLSVTTYIYLAFVNLFVFFQDTVMFLGVNLKTGNLFFVHDFRTSSPQLFRFVPVQQAWSLSIELMFYLIAPFILKRKWYIVLVIMFLSMALKIWGNYNGYNTDPWTYRFFPFELMYFLLGGLGYFIYKKVLSNIEVPNFFNVAIFAGLIFATIIYGKLRIHFLNDLYIFAIFIGVPFLFKYSKKFKWDNFIGELSYPMYITHILAKNLCAAAGFTTYLNIGTIVVSIFLSILLIKFVGDKIEALRQARVKSGNGIALNSGALAVKL